MATKTKTKKAKAKVKTATVHMALLLDESGSMSGREQGVIDGVNEFIGSLRDEQTDDETRVSLAMFDANSQSERVRVKWDGKLLADVPALTPGEYQPRGMTPLNDAVIDTIERVSGQMSEHDRAMLVVYTDGLENASRASYDTVRKLVTEKEAEGWAFIYLGAKQDEWAKQDQSVGMGARGQTFSTVTTSKGAHSSMSRAASLANTYRTTADQDAYLSAAAAMPKDIAEDEVDQRPKPKSKSSTNADSIDKASKYLQR